MGGLILVFCVIMFLLMIDNLGGPTPPDGYV